MDHAEILEVRDLSVRYRGERGDRIAVDDVSLSVRRGEILGIVGESGCGKSTLATGVLRLLRPPGYVAGGSAVFHPRGDEPFDLLTLDRRRLRTERWRRVAYLPQASMNSLNPTMKVTAQFADVMRAHAPRQRPRIDGEVRRLLDLVGLEPAVADMYPHELSGGMKQRVITAIAMCLDPELLVADEPTTALDVTVQRLIIQNLSMLRDAFGVTLVLITHDLGVHAQLADRVAVMHDGRIVEVGDVRQIFKEPAHPYTRDLLASVLRMPTMPGHREPAAPAAAGTDANHPGIDEAANADRSGGH